MPSPCTLVSQKMAQRKGVKLFNLEDRKTLSGAITDVDIFQWKSTILDNLKREDEFKEHCLESSKWETEKIKNRGFQDRVVGDGTATKRAEQVTSMLTKIAAFAPKAIVRDITKRSTCLADIWELAREWAGIQSTGSRHLDYYKVKKSYSKDEETEQEFYYRLRNAMEDTLIMKKDRIKDEGNIVEEDEDLTPTVKSLIVLDWLEAIGGSSLIQHVYRAYAKDLETVTLASIQPRLWKNISSLLKESSEENFDNDSQLQSTCRQVKSFSFRGRNMNERRAVQGRTMNQNRGRGVAYRNNDKFCKLCKASGSSNFRSHELAECWLLSDKDRNEIVKASARARALFATEEAEYEEHENISESELVDQEED